MAYEVASIFTLKDNFTSHLKEIIGSQEKFKKDTRGVGDQITKTYSTLKTESKSAAAALGKAQREAQKEFEKTGKVSVEMKKKIHDAVAQKVKIQFDTDSIKKAEKDLKSLEKEIKQVKNEKISPKVSVGGSGGSFSGGNVLGLLGGLGLIGAGVGAAYGIGRVGLGALNYSGEMEQTQMAFETMLKSKSAGQKMMNNLKKKAVETPFEFADLAKNAQFSMAMGFKEGDILSLLTDAGNAASGTGKGVEGMENIIRALGQMQQKGKVSAQEINQLAENGIGAWNYLAKSINKTTAETMKLAEDGLLPAEKSIEAIRKGMREDYGGMMIKQSKTLLGLFSSIKDFVQLNILGAFGDGIRIGILPSVQKLVDMLTQNEGGLENMQEKLRDIGKTIGTFVGDKADKLVKYFNDLFNNPDFQKADLGGKVKIVLDDMTSGMREWLDGSGGQKIRDFFSSASKTGMDIFVVTATDFVPEFAKIGVKIANEILKGMTDGLRDKFTSSFEEPYKNLIKPAGDITKAGESYFNQFGLLDKEKSNPVFDAIKGFFAKTWGIKSKAVGVSRVPYDNYPIMAHEGERLLTKQEAGRQGGGAITIAKLADTIIVREEADIDKIASRMVDKLLQAGLAYGG